MLFYFDKIYYIGTSTGIEKEIILKDLSIVIDGVYQNIPRNYIINDEECLRAYLRGLLISTGSANDPKTSRYHMEFVLDTKEYAEETWKVLDEDLEKIKQHWKNNRHHWQARQFDVCEANLTKEQILDCLENVLDWMAMGYAFNDRPYQFYEKNKNTIKLPQLQQEFIEKIIYEGVDKKYIKEEV